MYELFVDENGKLKKEFNIFLIKMGFILLFSLPVMWFKYLFTKRY